MELHYTVQLMMIFVFAIGIVMAIYSYQVMDHVEKCPGDQDAKQAARGLLTMSIALIAISATYYFTMVAICKQSRLHTTSVTGSVLFKTILVGAVLTVLIFSLIFSLRIKSACKAAEGAGNALQWISIGGMVVCGMVFVGYLTYLVGHAKGQKRSGSHRTSSA